MHALKFFSYKRLACWVNISAGNILKYFPYPRIGHFMQTVSLIEFNFLGEKIRKIISLSTAESAHRG